MTITDMKFSSAPQREIDQFSIPRADGIRVSNVNERAKIIMAKGILDMGPSSGDEEDLETYIDTIKKSLRGVSKQLVTVWGGKTRLYTATLQNTDVVFEDRERTHVTYCPFTLEFLCEGAATDWDYDQWTGEITLAADTIAATGDGTTEGKPVIVIVFSASTGVTSMVVSIDENDQQIGYSGALAAGDVLIFDCEQELVTLNGVDVDFTGYFPEMPLGDNTFRFTSNGSARTFRATILSKHSFL
jgi:phage-related protein